LSLAIEEDIMKKELPTVLFLVPALLLICEVPFLGGCRPSRTVQDPEPVLRALEHLAEAGMPDEAHLLLSLYESISPDCLVPGDEDSRIRCALVLAGAGESERAMELLDYAFTGEYEVLMAEVLSFRIAAAADGTAENGFGLLLSAPSVLSSDELLLLSARASELEKEAEMAAAAEELKKRTGYGLAAALLERERAIINRDGPALVCAEAEAGMYILSYTGELPELEPPSASYGTDPSASGLSLFFGAFFRNDYEEAGKLSAAAQALFPGDVPPVLAFADILVRAGNGTGEEVGHIAAELLALEHAYRDLPLYYTSLASAAAGMEHGTLLRRSSLEKAIAAAPASSSAMAARRELWRDESEPGGPVPGFFLLPGECASIASSPMLDQMPVFLDPLIGMLELSESRFTLAARDGLLTAMKRPAVRRYVQDLIDGDEDGGGRISPRVRTALAALF
jgi:hypothetical protein